MAVLLVVLSACTTAPRQIEPTQPSGTSPSSDVATPKAATDPLPEAGVATSLTGGSLPMTYELADCRPRNIPVAFAVLCDAYQRLEVEYVDPIEPAGLAAAAVLGMKSVDVDPAAGGVDTPGAVVPCHVPDAAFEVVCAELVDQLASGSAPASELVQAAVSGMFRFGLDPFSVYVPDEGSVTESFLNGFVYELGIVVAARDLSDRACSPIAGDCRLRVVSVFEFTPAADAGIREGDIVIAVDGSDLDGLAGEEAAARLWGDPGTGVSLTIDRDGAAMDIEMVRADIRFEPAEFEMLDGDIAYIRLNDFSQSAAIALGSVLGRSDVSAAAGLVLDLRDNPGGLVLAAQAVASQFIGSGDVMVEAYRDESFPIPVLEGGLATDGPEMVVLVNGASASAAEIVAAVLSERDRATVIGTPTFGKNLVQLVAPSRDGGEIRITAARWETPGGLDVALTGLEPDLVVEQTGEGDSQLEAALDLLG